MIVLKNGNLRLRKWFKQFLQRNKMAIDLERLKIIEKMYQGSKNILLNYKFNDGKKHWSMGSQMVIENGYKLFPELAKSQYAAVGSYSENEIRQEVKVPEVDYPFVIQVGAYFARRFDCDCEAKFTALGLNKNNEEVDKFYQEIKIGELQGLDTVKGMCPYTYVHGYIKSNAAIVVIYITNKDEKWWAGNYGARISHPFVRIIPI